MPGPFKFDRMELAGAMGDLGTLLPIAIAMVLINGLDPTGLFVSVALFYIVSGCYFGVTVPVQPMKVIGAYAIATALDPGQILASSLLLGGLLLLFGATGAIEAIRKVTAKSVIRGVQLSTGALLIVGGVKFIVGTSKLQILQQVAEPFLAVQTVGPVGIGIIIGAVGGIVTLLLLDNRRFPAGVIVVAGGLISGVVLGARVDPAPADLGFHLPEILPFAFPDKADFSFALLVLVLPQIPMTLGNAVLAYTDLSGHYFGESASRVTNRGACISMGLANLLSFALGGMPLCHGAGGLAAHYRFGARTAGSNLLIGLIFLVMALLLGDAMVGYFNLIPLSILGILLIFSGAQLALTLMDLESRRDYFVAIMILGITLASNLAAGFLSGIVLAWLLRWKKLSI